MQSNHHPSTRGSVSGSGDLFQTSMKTYGSVYFHPKKKHFELSVQPHVAIRLKRVFAKIHTYSGVSRMTDDKTLCLSATPENAFDLKWFLQRYPLEFENNVTE